MGGAQRCDVNRHTTDGFAFSESNPLLRRSTTRRAVLGYDSTREAVFFVAEDALKRVHPGMQFDESGLLGAFDANRDLIHAAAAKVYARGRRGSYHLVSADF
jgi:hypothetical protein